MGLNLMMSMPDSWNIQPGVYAVVAATAVLAGVFRSSISLVSPSRNISDCCRMRDMVMLFAAVMRMFGVVGSMILKVVVC